ncbi:MAG: cytochrome c3 family protein [Verrucomicrobiota bacterium]
MKLVAAAVSRRIYPWFEGARGGILFWRMLSRMSFAILFALVLLLPSEIFATDPPHLTSTNCAGCHISHGSPNGAILKNAGIFNLCASCHINGGSASNKVLVASDQAVVWPGLPADTNIIVTGDSHRWDSGAAGRLQFMRGAVTASTGQLLPSGLYTGAYAKTYTITIVTNGNVGAARFNWTTTPGGLGASNVVVAASNYLNEGVGLLCTNGTGTSFQVSDKWYLFVRADLRHPTNAALWMRMSNGLVHCSVCHDVHSQTNAPFDPKAPAYAGTNTGAGRHFMRIANNTEQMCVDCHAVRNVTNSVSGSHPVGLKGVTNAYYKYTTNLPLEKTTSNVRCLTCHMMHLAQANDGDLLRITNSTTMCLECHQLADTITPDAHFVTTNTALLWPGGQYGSTFPARSNAADRASCVNCHAPHGWPNATNTATHYPKLLVDVEENVCFTCHDTDGPANKNVKTDFGDKVHHPVGDADPWRRANRSVECEDCHNPHLAQVGAHVYTNIATSARNQVSNPLKGVSGVYYNYSTKTNNWQATNQANYAFVSKGSSTTFGATNEYQICFKCHTAYAFGSTPPAGITPLYTIGTVSFTTNSTLVTGSGTTWRTGTTNGAGMVGLWIYLTNNPAAAYRITNVASTTSLSITPPYAGATVSGQGYAMSGGTDLAQEFSPYNMSGHPVVAGLDYFSNSIPVGTPSKRGLQIQAMKPPWTNNVGQQTMMCSDCHNTDGATTAAQGPHGSATQFMLRGPGIWPNTTTFTSSWCANCHNDRTSFSGHGNHQGAVAGCYSCHIVIPHGGKVSRLIATTSMPARYAFSNNLSYVNITQFRKSSYSYPESGYCKTTCSHHSGGSGNETW